MTNKEGDWINCDLVINKEPEEQKHIREILKNAATEITCVTSIGYAIIELSKKKFDFIILDASFTETDGSALIDALQLGFLPSFSMRYKYLDDTLIFSAGSSMVSPDF